MAKSELSSTLGVSDKPVGSSGKEAAKSSTIKASPRGSTRFEGPGSGRMEGPGCCKGAEFGGDHG